MSEMTPEGFLSALLNISEAKYGKDVREGIVYGMQYVNTLANEVGATQREVTDLLEEVQNGDIITPYIDSIINIIKTGSEELSNLPWEFGRIDTTDGETMIDTSSYIRIRNKIKILSNKVKITISEGYEIYFYVYDSNKTFIRGYGLITSEGNGYYSDINNIEGCYIRMICRKTDHTPFSSNLIEPITIKFEEILSDQKEDTLHSAYRYEPVNFTVSDGYYRAGSNEIISTYGYYHSRITVNEGEEYLVSGTTVYPSYYIPCAVAVDNHGNVLKSYGGNSSSGAVNYYNVPVTIPENAVYLYVNGRYVENIKILKGTKDWFNNVYAPLKLIGKKVVFLGDSIFGNADGDFSIPGYFGRITGATVYNHAIGGSRGKSRGNGTSFTTSRDDCWGAIEGERLATAIATGSFTNQLSAVASGSALSGQGAYTKDRITAMSTFDYSKVDYFIINWATNDFTGGSGISGWTTGMTSVINKLCTAYPSAKIVLCSATQRFVDNNGTRIDGNTYSLGGETLRDFVNAAEEFSYIQNIPYINLYNIGINLHNWETHITNGGTHPNDSGRQRIAEVIANAIV